MTILDTKETYEHLPYVFSYWLRESRGMLKTDPHKAYKCKQLYKKDGECLWHQSN